MRNILLRTLQIFVITAFLTVLSASGATLTVTKIVDTADGVCDADCSLREAIAAAAVSGDTIEFASPLFDSPQVITLSDAAGFQQLLILKNLIIKGRGANLLTVRRLSTASARFRIFSIGSVATVTLQNMKITGGSDGGGGGVLNDNGTLTINNCHITGNVAEFNGGGVRNVSGTININNTTVSDNIAGIFNGAGIATTGGTVNIANSTVSGNVTNSGNVGTGGIWTSGGALNITNSTVTNNRAGGVMQENSAIITIRNSIVAANYNNAVKPDVVGAFVSNGYNIIGNVGAATGFPNTGDQTGTSAAVLDPRLAPLGDFGGKTLTHALFRNSPAVDAADPNNALTFDQRGIRRTIGGRADIGAFENNFTFSNNPTGTNGDGNLPAGTINFPYSVQFSAVRRLPSPPSLQSKAFAPLIFSIFAGSLPAGLSLDENTGVLSGTPTQSGTFNFTVKITDAADGSAGAQAYTLFIVGPTAADVTVGGRVLTPEGSGLPNARVTLIDATGAQRTALTSAFGYYRFDEIPAGQTVVVQVSSKRYSFQPQIVNLTENSEDFDFTAMTIPNVAVGVFMKLSTDESIRGDAP